MDRLFATKKRKPKPNHQKWYREGRYPQNTCDGCQKAFASENALQQHNRDKAGQHFPRARNKGPRRGRRNRNVGATSLSYWPDYNEHTDVYSTPGLLPRGSFLRTLPRDGYLNEYVITELQPTAEFNERCNAAVDRLCKYLKEKSPQISVAEVVKGGSLAKGTEVRDDCDLDAFVYINDFDDMDDYISRKGVILQQIEHMIKNWRGPDHVQHEATTAHTVKIKLRASILDPFLGVDIVPTFDNLKKKGKRATYNEMDGRNRDDWKHYNLSLASLQVDFVRTRPANVKNLIRLVKHWRKTHFNETNGKDYPKSYVLELLIIHLWENAGEPPRFVLEKAFKNVMFTLIKYRDIDAVWNVYYKQRQLESYRNRAKKLPGCPFIVDPADPFDNVCLKATGTWYEVAQMALNSYNSDLLRSVNGSSWL